MSYTHLQQLRQDYQPPLPSLLKYLNKVNFKKGEVLQPTQDQNELKSLFPKTYGQVLTYGMEGKERVFSPLRVGVVLSGGQAAGGHNVITGLYDAISSMHHESKLFGFLGGPSGIISGKFKELTKEMLASYRNQGGFDLIGSGRTKIETEEQLVSSLQVIQNMKLDGLVIIGGDDSNTNAAVLAEYFLQKGCKARVIGVPKTIDGDLKNAYVATSFGFDTACKIYSEMIGNIARDALSAKKYTHFIKLMGRSASHIALECALATHPNVTIIGEEVAAKKMTLQQITTELSDIISKRAEKGKNYGVVLIPEGLIEFIPEMRLLISELNKLLAGKTESNIDEVKAKLSSEAQTCFNSLPESIQKQLFLDRDPHGNVQVSQIETEKLLVETVSKELKKREVEELFKGKFSPLCHFFGYEGRAGFPSNFDAHYCYALGMTSALLIAEELTGYMAFVGNLEKKTAEWTIGGLPIVSLMNIESRHGKSKPVIKKALVELQRNPFLYFQKHREIWAINDDYCFTGPIQFYGEESLTNSISFTLQLESNS